MIEPNIPGLNPLRLEHLVCDINGILAMDGELSDGLVCALSGLQNWRQVHFLIADTGARQPTIDALHLLEKPIPLVVILRQ